MPSTTADPSAWRRRHGRKVRAGFPFFVVGKVCPDRHGASMLWMSAETTYPITLLSGTLPQGRTDENNPRWLWEICARLPVRRDAICARRPVQRASTAALLPVDQLRSWSGPLWTGGRAHSQKRGRAAAHLWTGSKAHSVGSARAIAHPMAGQSSIICPRGTPGNRRCARMLRPFARTSKPRRKTVFHQTSQPAAFLANAVIALLNGGEECGTNEVQGA
jgi:hypothetical protein